jgi:hypothetical protein
MDRKWWNQYFPRVSDFAGELAAPLKFDGVKRYSIETFKNSGAGAINLAITLGAKRVILLGYDCQKTGGKAHWHGNHEKGLGNAGSIRDWPAQFAKLAKVYPDTDIINASRETALTCFRRADLDEVLNECY